MSGSITTRLIVLLTLCAVAIIGTGMLVDYQLSRAEILERLQRESQDATRAAVIDLENWLDGVEGSTRLLARILEQRDYTDTGLKQMLRDVVDNNADIFGAAIALAPARTAAPLGFAPYYFRREGQLEYADLAGPEHNYQQQAWFTDTLAAGQPLWIEPYYDEGGGEALMTTFAIPVYRSDATGQSSLYAVVTADVALSKLHDYLQHLRLGSSGFGILLSRGGTILSSKHAANVMQHYSSTTASALDPTGWQQMFDAALAGQVTTRRMACEDVPGQCVFRLGALDTTGWPVGIVYSENEILAPLRAFQIKTAISGLATLLLMAVAVVIVSRRLTRPLVALTRASDTIAKGELDAPLPAASGDDEVSRLIYSFGTMQSNLKTYIADLEIATARRSRLEGELAAAREIQMSMLPHRGEASEGDECHALWARVRPARSVGGDLYSYQRQGSTLFIAVGDVSDKGVPAALFMARAMGLIQQLGSTMADPAAAMAGLNNALENGNDNCMFLTLFLGVLDLQSLELRFSSAGHTPPSLLRQDTAESIEQEQGPALGLVAGLEYVNNTLQLLPGDRLAVFTDGIDEAFNERDAMFGIDRLNADLLATRSQPVKTVGEQIFQAIDQFAGSTPQSDDITLMLLDLPAGNSAIEALVDSQSERFTLTTGLTSRVHAWLEQTLAQLPPGALQDLQLVAEEIVSNVSKYAGLPAGANVYLTLNSDARQVVLETRDQGAAFDPLAQSDRAELGEEIDSASIGGLGVHLITSLTDRQSYRREKGWNILQVIKLLEKQPEQLS